MKKDLDGSGETPSPSPAGSREDFVRDGHAYTWFESGTPCRRVKLHNRRVLVGYTGDKWYLYFKRLVSVKERQISSTKLAISKEAGEALYLLLASFIHPNLAAFVMAQPSASEAEPAEASEAEQSPSTVVHP